MDPLQTLQKAYAVPPDSKEQEDLLAQLRESLESNPSFVPLLCSSLIRTVTGAQDSILKRWTLDLLHYAISRANLPVEKRTERAYTTIFCWRTNSYALTRLQSRYRHLTFWDPS